VFAFLGAPTMWVLHLGLSYFLVVVGCGTGWTGTRTLVIVLTVVCAIAAVGSGVFAWKRVNSVLGRSGTPLLETDQMPEFLALSGAMLAVLFTGAIILAGVSPLFLPLCSPS
jgi:hypothetical protein